jgi:hypothetical protein
MKGKTHQNLKVIVGWKSSNGRWCLWSHQRKERKKRVGEWQKRREIVREGRKTPAFI